MKWSSGFAAARSGPSSIPLTTREERVQFLERYERDLADAYDVAPDGGLLFLYPRLFLYARKGRG